MIPPIKSRRRASDPWCARLRAAGAPTTFAGTPATVTLFGTGLSTTEPAAMRAQCPTSILPRILAPAPISTPWRIFGMAVAGFLAGAAERHVVQHRHVVVDHRGLAHHKAGGVVEEDAAADLRAAGWMSHWNTAEERLCR